MYLVSADTDPIKHAWHLSSFLSERLIGCKAAALIDEIRYGKALVRKKQYHCALLFVSEEIFNIGILTYECLEK